MRILFEPSGDPRCSIYISYCVAKMERHYARAVHETTRSTETLIDFSVFSRSAVRVMVTSNMTRRGPFQGVRLVRGEIHDPDAILNRVWDAVGKGIVKLKSLMLKSCGQNRSRMLVEMPEPLMDRIVADLRRMFNRLLPLCRGVKTPGRTAASKILFSVFPEIALPVEKALWKDSLQAVDYADIIRLMRAEISAWESRSRKRINDCDPHGSITLPTFYNAVVLRVIRE